MVNIPGALAEYINSSNRHFSPKIYGYLKSGLAEKLVLQK